MFTSRPCSCFTAILILVGCICITVTGVTAQDTDAGQSITNEVTDGLDLTARWASFTDSTYKFGEKWETLRNLKPAQKEKRYSMSQLAVLLPPTKIAYGECYKIRVEDVVPVLKQFHSGATHRMHHGGPRGGFGRVTAENDRYRRIQTRIHAEFDLADGKYTPSQFAGDLIIDRATNGIIAFKLAVPPRRNNVDVNWERVPAEGEMWSDRDGNVIPARTTIIADIGYCEKMELVGGDQELAHAISWDRELAIRDVDKTFRRKFYAFAGIDWLPWEEAVAESQRSGKPLHVVALFGSLDDESC